MYNMDLALNNLQGLIYYKTKTNLILPFFLISFSKYDNIFPISNFLFRKKEKFLMKKTDYLILLT